MPYLKITTNCKPEKDTSEIIKVCSSFVAGLLQKPERYVMVEFIVNPDMLFGGSNQPLAYVELKSIGLPTNKTREFSSELCNFISSHFEIPGERVYIEFSDVERAMWGWNNTTFER